MARGRRRSLACLLVAASLAAAFLGCRREDPKIRALTERAAQADDAAQQLRRAWRAQLGRLTLAGIKGLRPEDEPMPLTGEQKRALEARVRLEKDSSRRGLLREILDADLEIQSLNGRLRDLRADLPAPEIVRSNDSHYGLAMRFLKARGCSEEQARAALSRVTLSERVTPGFEVYHFYVDGQYGTWVAQGRVPISPRELTREDADTLPAERDEAVARGRRLQRELGLLETQKRRIEEEIAAIHEERSRMLEGHAQLQTENARQLARLNSLHYLVGTRAALERAGIIEVPLFGKDHSGRNWADTAFTRDLDLRAGTRILIQARELGLKRIGNVIVVPGSYQAGEHYRISLDADRQTATVDLLALPRFKNDKVVFAVEE